MANHEELFTRRFGGGKRTYYLDVKQDTNGERYIVISESTRKDGDRKMRSRVMVWKEDFDDLFDCLNDLQDYMETGHDNINDVYEDDEEEDEDDPDPDPDDRYNRATMG